MIRRLLPAAALLLPLGTLPLPAAAQQQSQSYKFLEAIRKGDGNAVIATLDQPGQTIINTRDVTTGEGALHIVVKRGDSAYLRYLLAKGANANLADGGGETPLIRAVQRRDLTLVRAVLAAGGNPDQTDNLAGLSARAYAKRDPRSTAIAKVLDETPPKTKRAVAGPRM